MKILKIFGLVVGVHVFALILIFANPGCSSTRKPAPAPAATAPRAEPAPAIGSAVAPAPSDSIYSSTTDASAPAPAPLFNPEAPAVTLPAAAGGGPRIAPTRPGTPVAGVLVAEPVADVTPAASYTVKSGDSLWTIARKHNLTVAQLTAANSLSANAPLRLGQKLVIPSRPATPASSGSTPAAKPADATAAARAPGETVKHVVKSGETLGAIARRYDVRQGDLAVLNNISDPAKIRPGMELVIPGYKAPASKAGKSTKSSGGTAKSAAPAPAPEPAPAPAPAVEPVPQIPTVVEPAPAAPPPAVPVIKIN
jgi:LysM repeat protein